MIRKFTSVAFLLALAALLFPKVSIAQDAGVVGVIVPDNNKCGSSTTVVKIVVRNYGSSSLTNIPVVYQIGSSQFLDTLKKTLAAGLDDTVTLTHSLNTSSGGTWLTKTYTKLSSDVDRTNDTVKTLHVRFKPLSAPKVKDTTRCGAGPATLGSAPTKKPVQTRWYKDATTTTVAYIGDTVTTTQVTRDTFFYAAQVYDTITLKGSVRTSPTYDPATLRLNSGHMFDITAKKDLVIDSFAMWGFYNTGNDDVQLYYKAGSYKGYEQNSSAWTYVGSYSIYKAGFNKRVGIKLGGIKMIPGATYGIYLSLKSEARDITYPCIKENVCDHDSIRQNDDIKLTTGSTLEKNFGSGSLGVSPYRDWDGQVYYSVGADCNSPRSKVTVKVKASPLSAKIIQSKPYQGYFSDGTTANPDLVCPGDTLRYELQPPTGLKNTDLGTKWNILGLTFTTLKGSGPFVKDTITAKPNAIANGAFMFIPSVKAGDSTYILRIELEMVGGCKGTISRVISVGSRPKPKFGFTQVCVGQSMDLIDSSTVPAGTNTWLYKMGNGDEVTQANGSYTYTKAGTYTITQYVTTSRGCMDSTQRKVVMYDYPQPKFSFISACEGKPFAFFDSTTTKGIASRLWKFGPKGATSTLQNPTYIYALAGTYTVWLVETSLGGCKDSVKQTVTVLSKPKPDFTYTLACVGKTIQFTNKSTNVPPGVLYDWDFGDGLKSTAKDPAHAFIDPGTFDVRLVVTNPNGCRDTVIKSVTPYEIPYADFRYTEVCEGDLTEFYDSSDNAGNWTWDFGDGSAPSAQKNTKHKYAKAGTYDVLLVIKSPDPAGCIDSMKHQVRVFTIPKASFTAQTVCLGKATPFKNNSTGTGLTYLWTFETGKTSTAQDPTYTFGTAGNHNVTLDVKSANGCTHTTTVTVTVSDAPKISYTFSHYQDHPRNIQFTPSNSGYSTYRWYFGDGDTSTDVSPIHLFSNPDGIYKVTLVITDASGCKGVYIDTVGLGVNGIADKDNSSANQISVYPNPFSKETTISYELQKRSAVNVVVEDMQGRTVAVLYNGLEEQGRHTHVFNAAEHKAAPGMYMLKLSVGSTHHVNRIIYVE
jgi:PKD repeat protein